MFSNLFVRASKKGKRKKTFFRKFKYISGPLD